MTIPEIIFLILRRPRAVGRGARCFETNRFSKNSKADRGTPGRVVIFPLQRAKALKSVTRARAMGGTPGRVVKKFF